MLRLTSSTPSFTSVATLSVLTENKIMITAFNRSNLRGFTDDVVAHLKAIEAKWGVSFTYQGANYSHSGENALIKIQAAVVGNGGVPLTREREDFRKYCAIYELVPTDIDKEITYAKERYIIKGISTRRSKYPIIATRISTGETTMLQAEGVKRALAREATVQVNPPAPTARPAATLADILAEGEIQAIEGAQE